MSTIFDKQEEFTDETIMWFGQHKDQTLANVPEDWLRWFYDTNESRLTKHFKLKQYIHESILQYDR